MTALNRKLLRDLWVIKTQALAIALVMASGVATFVMSRCTLTSLREARERYYERNRFADVFTHLKRAPNSLVTRIAEIPGIAAVQSRVVVDVTLDVPGLAEPAVGRIVSIPDHPGHELNALHLRRGRYPEPGRDGEVLVNEAFAEAHAFTPGDSVRAIINGRLQTLRFAGIALSPEYIHQVRPSEIIPDDKRFGVFWMVYTDLAAAYDMQGAFNDLSVTLPWGASVPEVLRRLDDLTEPYGGTGAYSREDQLSHRRLSDELTQLRASATIPSFIFLSVTAFLLHVVISRLIQTQRQQIAVLKAFGYTRGEIGAHYLKLVLAMVAAGLILGAGAGAWLGQYLAHVYARYFRFPELAFQLDVGVLFVALLVGAGASLLGAVSALRRAMQLPPAEAMRPEPPADFHPTLLERVGLQRFFSQVARMVLRQLERSPVKAALSTLGIALAIAILILGSFAGDVVNHAMDFEFYQMQRHDMNLGLVEPTASTVLHELNAIPGVMAAEGFRSVPVRIRWGHHARRLAVTGLPPDQRLFRLLDANGHPMALPPGGLVVSKKLAELLGARVGDRVTLEVLEGARPVRRVEISALLDDFVGTSAYMELAALNRLMSEGETVSGAFLLTDARASDSIYARLKATPRVAGVNLRATTVAAYKELMRENLLRMRLINVTFACIIAFGVVYNAARIALSERGRELATLRVIGFTRAEISWVFLGEIAVLTGAAIPFGLALGRALAALMIAALETETQRFPVVVNPATYGFAVVTVLVAAIVSSLVVRRRLDRLDLVAVLKAAD
jgi:putative ABC transport system permease protein